MRRRLELIFAEGYPDRNNVVRDLAAATTFAFLYVGAVDGAGRHLAPRHVFRMTDERAARRAESDRDAYFQASRTRAAPIPPGEKRWYEDNTREPIRDETIRGLRNAGAIGELPLETTSSLPRYYLASDFAALFDPGLEEQALEEAIERWRAAHIDERARRRMHLLRRTAAAAQGRVTVALPTGEVRLLGVGKSAALTKAVVERFAPRFLREPVVVWISESGHKVYDREEALTRALGLDIDVGQLVPDVILAEAGVDPELVIFVEVVISDGPVTGPRRDELQALASRAGYRTDQLVFGTVYLDRSAGPLKRNLPALATGSFVWCAAEEDTLIVIGDETAATALLAGMLQQPCQL
ncbi:MAG TPA: BsuBI/PstI family type II restriction endonuclease [Geminicoccaceae bacterium]|nr:BsuBI/PstI family type II restriction endonuclease [Geminicoccaceae bacterium]